jgi:chitinase
MSLGLPLESARVYDRATLWSRWFLLTLVQVEPEDLNLAGFTHINFAFAFFDPNTFQIAPMDSSSASLYHRFTALKEKQDGLQTWISVGGQVYYSNSMDSLLISWYRWSFTDPGPTRSAFSNMAGSAANRKSFITGLLKFMNTYGFDGVDLDWVCLLFVLNESLLTISQEYPQADDRGGQSGDMANYVILCKELKSALGSKGLTVTLPTSYWYLRHIDVKAMQTHVDW